MRSFTVSLFAALRACSKVVAVFDGVTVAADPIALPAEPGRPLRLTAQRGDYVLHIGDQPVQIDANGATSFVDIEGRRFEMELWSERRLCPVDVPNATRLVFETYQCGLADGRTELGWCFKPGGGDDCLHFDLVLGAFDSHELTQSKSDDLWNRSKWAAAAIAAAYLPEQSPASSTNAPAALLAADEEQGREVIKADADLTATQLDDKYNLHGDGEHPGYPRESWREAVGAQQTLLGYWTWVEHQLGEDAELDTGGALNRPASVTVQERANG